MSHDDVHDDLRPAPGSIASVNQPSALPLTPLSPPSDSTPLDELYQCAVPAASACALPSDSSDPDADVLVSSLNGSTSRRNLHTTLTLPATVTTPSIEIPGSPLLRAVAAAAVSPSRFPYLLEPSGICGMAKPANAHGVWSCSDSCNGGKDSSLDLDRTYVKMMLITTRNVPRPALATLDNVATSDVPPDGIHIVRGAIPHMTVCRALPVTQSSIHGDGWSTEHRAVLPPSAHPLDDMRALRAVLQQEIDRPIPDAASWAQSDIDVSMKADVEGVTEAESVGVSALLSLAQFKYPSRFTRVLDGSLDYPPLRCHRRDSSTLTSSHQAGGAQMSTFEQNIMDTTPDGRSETPTFAQQVNSVTPQPSHMHMVKQRGEYAVLEPSQTLILAQREQEQFSREYCENSDVELHLCTTAHDPLAMHLCTNNGAFPRNDDATRHVDDSEPGHVSAVKAEQPDETILPWTSQTSVAERQMHKEYWCEHCANSGLPRIFTRMTDFHRHVKSIHLGEAYICPFCRRYKEFSRSDSLRRHVRRCHPSQVGTGVLVEVTRRRRDPSQLRS